MSEHTPGNWRASSKMEGIHILTADGVDFAAIETLVPNAEGEGNARLMAAAPELLAALRKIATADISDGMVRYELKEIARAAVEKAEGS